MELGSLVAQNIEGSTPQSMGIHSLFGGNLEADREAAQQQQQQRRIEEFLRRNGVLFEYSVTTTGRASFGLRTVPRERVKKMKVLRMVDALLHSRAEGLKKDLAGGQRCSYSRRHATSG